MVRETVFRVRYSEIDAQGHVNNANYLSFFEVGRVEWLRDADLSYKELESRGFGFVVVEALVHYHSAAFFDDELVVRTELTEAGRVALRFRYEVLRGEKRIASGHTRHACVRLPGGRPVRMPEEVRALAADPA